MTTRPPTGLRGRHRPSLAREQVGERLRGWRKARGLTLKQLAERSGVALSTLSKMELGQISVSYEKLAAAAHALGIDLGELFDGQSPVGARASAQPVVVRTTPDDALRYDTDNYGYRILAAAFPGKRMTPMMGTIAARSRAEFPEFIRHAGQEFVMVLSGKVRIEFETGESIALARHESAYFDSGVGHVYLSTSKVEAQIVVVMAE